MIQAEKVGCDTPTEAMIADAINDAVYDAYTECQAWLIDCNMQEAADAIDRAIDRKHSEHCNDE